MRWAPAVSALGALALAPALAAAGVPPETTITAGPQGPTSDSSPSFHFGSDPQVANFECRLDGGTWTLRGLPPRSVAAHLFDNRWEPCVSPKSYRHLADGPHRFEVRAVDGDGAIDPSSATREFDLDTSVRSQVRVPSRQAQPRRTIRVAVRIAAEEGLLVRARGSVSQARGAARGKTRFALRGRSVRIEAGERRTLRLPAERWSEGRRAAAAVRRGNHATAKVTVRLANESESSARRRFTARLTSRR